MVKHKTDKEIADAAAEVQARLKAEFYERQRQARAATPPTRKPRRPRPVGPYPSRSNTYLDH